MAGGNGDIKKNLYKTAVSDIYTLKKDIDGNRFRLRNIQKAVWDDDAVILSQMLSEIATAKKSINWADIIGAPTSLPPSGAAGGDLTGTYPSPTITSFQGLAVLLGVPVLNDVITWDGTKWISAAGGGGGGVTSVSGTANRITSTGGATPVIDIAATYIGQTSITTLGTITTGAWNATKVSEVYGGTNQSTYITGDVLYSSAANTLSKLGIGTAGQVLTVAAGIPSWATPTTGLTTLTIGTTTITSGTTQRLLYDNAGVLGEIAVPTVGKILRSDGTSWTASTATYPTTVTSGRLIMASASDVVSDVAMSGDATITNAGVITVTSLANLKKGSFGATWNGQGGVVTNSNTAIAEITFNYSGNITDFNVESYYTVAGVPTALAGTIVFDIYRSGASIIGAGNKPSLTAASSNSAAVAGWTSTAVTAGDKLYIYIVGTPVTVLVATVTINITKS